MSGVNRCFLLGRLGKDPEVSEKFTKFSLATSKTWVKDGEKKETVQWHRVVAFGTLGSVCGTYLKKGKQVFVEGELQYGTYDKEGITRYTTDIIANSVQFLGSSDSAKEETEVETAAPPDKTGNGKAKKGVKNYAPGADNSHLDDDIPF